MTGLTIQLIPLLKDNYSYLLTGAGGGPVGVVDPSEPEGVVRFLEERGLGLDFVLNTHHHWDHVGGNLALKERYGCQVVGPAYDQDRIPGIDIAVSESDTFEFGNHQARIIPTPGHTRGGIVYWFWRDDAAFCGDTLFSVGCGRLFEGTPEQMWTSLKRIRELPPSTRIYCGHEYTEANIRFALSVDPENDVLKAMEQRVRACRGRGEPTIPALLGEELLVNPFLRADDPGLSQRLGKAGASEAEVFAEIRARKDVF